MISDINGCSHHPAGAALIQGRLRCHGHWVGRTRVTRITAEHGLVGLHGRKKWRRSKANTVFAPNHLERAGGASQSETRRRSDVARLPRFDGQLFLQGIGDVFDSALVALGRGRTSHERTRGLGHVDWTIATTTRQRATPSFEHRDSSHESRIRQRSPRGGALCELCSIGDAFDNTAMADFWAPAKREIKFLYGLVRQLTRPQKCTITEHIEFVGNRQ